MSASSASANRADSQGIERRILFAYGLPGLVTAIPTVPVFTLLPVFYAGEVGVGLAMVLMIYRNRRSIALDELSEMHG